MEKYYNQLIPKRTAALWALLKIFALISIANQRLPISGMQRSHSYSWNLLMHGMTSSMSSGLGIIQCVLIFKDKDVANTASK